MEKCSPTSLKVTLKLLQQGKQLDLATCLRVEYTVCQHFMKCHDFYEGVRAAIIDKDRQPNWQPATLTEVTDTIIQAFFNNE